MANSTPCAKSREDCCTKTAINQFDGKEIHNNQPDNEDDEDDDDDDDRMRMRMRTRIMMMTRTRTRTRTRARMSDDNHP